MYDVNYFIKKFEVIPENKWCTGMYHDVDTNASCAYGHCGLSWTKKVSDSPEAKSLSLLIYDVVGLNDGENQKYQQPTPKQRILAALYDIIDKELSEANVIEASKLINEYILV